MRARLDLRALLGAPALLSAASLAAAVAIRLDLLPLLRGPAPYPPEWQWGYRAVPLARLWPALIVALLLLAALAASATRPARARPRATARLLLALASLGGVGFPLALLAREPQGALRALLARAASPSISSYHTVATSEQARDPLLFLRAHARLLPELLEGRKHAATHPPGPVLWYRAALAVCERAPALGETLLTFAGVERTATQSEQGRAVRAAALLGALGLGLLGALTVWPLDVLARALGLERLAAARLASLWVLLPGPALMTPALDATVAFLVTACSALVALASRRTRWRGTLAFAVLAGACGGLAVFTSYGALGFLGLGSLAVIASAGRVRAPRALAAAATAGGGTLLVAFGIPALLGHEPLVALRTALALHRLLYTAPRDYRLWLVFDPLDFALFLGLPLALVGVWAGARSLVRRAAPEPARSLDRFRIALAAGMAALLLAGVTRGEVGRLWIPLMPFALLASASVSAHDADAESAAGIGALVAALTLAMASCWLV